MTLQHSAKPPEDLEGSRAIRFFFRGDRDLVECLVDWDALDKLEGSKVVERSSRIAAFEQHRSKIEAVALRKLERAGNGGRTLRLSAGDVA